MLRAIEAAYTALTLAWDLVALIVPAATLAGFVVFLVLTRVTLVRMKLESLSKVAWVGALTWLGTLVLLHALVYALA